MRRRATSQEQQPLDRRGAMTEESIPVLERWVN
jgi:hypothetical protein